MSRLTWDASGERFYETGVKQGVLYPMGTDEAAGTYPAGVVWNGLSGVSETPSGAESNPVYADDMKYLNLISIEEFGATIEAYSSPEEFDECDGTKEVVTGVVVGQQARRTFGFCYRTSIGNDEDGSDHGYKLHLIYGCLASPSERSYTSINDSPEAMSLSWEITTTPIAVTNQKATSRIIIDSTRANVTCLKALEDVLYGVDAPAFSTSKTYAVGAYVTYESKVYKCTTAVSTAGEWNATNWTEVTNPGPRLPLPDEVISIMTPATV